MYPVGTKLTTPRFRGRRSNHLAMADFQRRDYISYL